MQWEAVVALAALVVSILVVLFGDTWVFRLSAARRTRSDAVGSDTIDTHTRNTRQTRRDVARRAKEQKRAQEAEAVATLLRRTASLLTRSAVLPLIFIAGLGVVALLVGGAYLAVRNLYRLMGAEWGLLFFAAVAVSLLALARFLNRPYSPTHHHIPGKELSEGTASLRRSEYRAAQRLLKDEARWTRKGISRRLAVQRRVEDRPLPSAALTLRIAGGYFPSGARTLTTGGFNHGGHSRVPVRFTVTNRGAGSASVIRVFVASDETPTSTRSVVEFLPSRKELARLRPGRKVVRLEYGDNRLGPIPWTVTVAWRDGRPGQQQTSVVYRPREAA